MWRRTGVVAAVMVLAACTGGPVPEQKKEAPRDEVEVKHDPDSRETDYMIASGDCQITWTVFKTEANRGVIRHRAECRLPLAEQAPLVGKVLKKVMAADAEAAGFRTLVWDRLYPDGAEAGKQDVTMAKRLALAASQSAEWDAAKGVPRGGDINGWVRKISNDAPIYEELRPVFREAGLEIRLSSVEKVLVMPVAKLVFFDELRGSGARAADKVPFDCQTWFSVRRAAEAP